MSKNLFLSAIAEEMCDNYRLELLGGLFRYIFYHYYPSPLVKKWRISESNR